MANKDVLLVATYYSKPRQGVKTSKPGWAEVADNLAWDEHVELTLGLRKKDAVTAKIIMNLSQKRIDRNGWGSSIDFDTMLKYFFVRGYDKYITTVYARLDPAYMEKIVKDLEEAAKELPEDTEEASNVPTEEK